LRHPDPDKPKSKASGRFSEESIDRGNEIRLALIACARAVGCGRRRRLALHAAHAGRGARGHIEKLPVKEGERFRRGQLLLQLWNDDLAARESVSREQFGGARSRVTGACMMADNAWHEAAGWSIIGVTNMAGILSEKGFTLHPVLVFDACSGKYSADLLSKDETRFVASMIPCRVAIYQTSTGKVVISRMNSIAMAGMVGGHAGTVIRKSGEEMEQIVAATLKKLGK